jgi:hypothetical protein
LDDLTVQKEMKDLTMPKEAEVHTGKQFDAARSSMSLNRIVSFIIVAGYLLVNIRMQMVFSAGPPTPEHNIWSKYQIATTWQDALRIAQEAYYAETGWLVLLLVLLVFNVPFGFAFGLT